MYFNKKLLIQNFNTLYFYKKLHCSLCIFNNVYIFRKKNCLLDDEIDLLKQKEKNISKACYKTENNLDTTMKTFSEKIDAFGTNINKLHHHVTKSMKNVRTYFLRIPSHC